MKLYQTLFILFSAITICTFSELNISAQENATTTTTTTTTTTQIDNTVTTTSTINGWIEENDKKYYFENGIKVIGLHEIDGKEYYFASNGAVKSGWYTINDIRMYFSPETFERKLGWIEYNNNTFYLNNNGKLIGKHTIDNKDYIFDEFGICQSGWFEYNGNKYYSDFRNGLYKNKCIIDNEIYYFSSKGKFQSGWVTSDDIRIFYDYETTKPVYGFINYNGNRYYSDIINGKITGDTKIDGITYRFDNYGCQQTGFQKFPDGTRYYTEKGEAINDFLQIKNNTYYFCNYLMQTGFQIIDNNTYYFNNNGIMQTNWQSIDNNKYYFNENGVMQTGFKIIDNKTYYFNKNGIMQTNWQSIDNNKYYFDKNGIMQIGFKIIDNKTYYFNKNGIMQTNWQKIDNKEYYFDDNGIMYTGWQKIDNKEYYFDDNGIMYTGWQKIDEKYYLLGDDGSLQEQPKIFVGVGHGGYDPGAVSYIVEKEYTLKTAKAVAEILKSWGLNFMLSRSDDIDTTMESKLKLCNDYDPDLIIDIHFNAVGGNGFEVYHSQYGGMSLTLAENINNEVDDIMKSNGCKIMLYPDGRDRFTIIRETHAPAVLLEGGYVDNYYDAEFIKNNYTQLARAYAEGILKTLNIIMKDKK